MRASCRVDHLRTIADRQKPMKGMLTRPVSISNWSFVCDDQSRSISCKQLALTLARYVDSRIQCCQHCASP